MAWRRKPWYGKKLANWISTEPSPKGRYCRDPWMQSRDSNVDGSERYSNANLNDGLRYSPSSLEIWRLRSTGNPQNTFFKVVESI